MPPQNQNQPNNVGRYDFFMNPQQPKKPGIVGPSSVKSRLLLVVGGIVLLIIIFSVIGAILGGGPNPVQLQTIVAQDQQEIVRLNMAAAHTALSPETKNFAITAQFTITSDQQQLVAYLAKNGAKLSDKQLGLKHSAQNDQNLTTALSAGVYDQTFNGIMKTEMTSYARDLTTAYKSTKGITGRKLLKADYSSALVFLSRIKNLPTQ
jgi:hypothetical protein